MTANYYTYSETVFRPEPFEFPARIMAADELLTRWGYSPSDLDWAQRNPAGFHQAIGPHRVGHITPLPLAWNIPLEGA